ncbi:hypothetical protein D3C73_1383060 [compost metagenome]
MDGWAPPENRSCDDVAAFKRVLRLSFQTSMIDGRWDLGSGQVLVCQLGHHRSEPLHFATPRGSTVELARFVRKTFGIQAPGGGEDVHVPV